MAVDLEKLKEKIIGRLSGIEREGITNIINYLNEQTDYFSAPASTKFHSNYKGGLAIHSDLVTDLLIEKNERYNLNFPIESIYICGYLHDLCKCNIYEEGYKLAKNDENKWISQKAYITNDTLPLGHGGKSIILIQQHGLILTKREALAIYWHMGPFCPKEEYYQLNEATEQCPAITAMFTADYEASHLLETVIDNEETYPVEKYNQYVKNKNKSKKR